MPSSLFEDGIDSGDFVIKAQAKIPVTQFRSSILQSLVDKLTSKYEERIDEALSGITKELLAAKAAKAMRLVVFDGGMSDELRKAEGKDGHKKDGGYTDVKDPGSRGGKFWRDPKGHIRYDKRPEGPSPKHVEATDEEVEEHIRKQVTPQLCIG